MNKLFVFCFLLLSSTFYCQQSKSGNIKNDSLFEISDERSPNAESKKPTLSEKEKLDKYYLEQYGRRYEDYQKMFKHLPERSIKKIKTYSYRLRKYTTLNVVWFPRQEAINNQKYIDSKHRSMLLK